MRITAHNLPQIQFYIMPKVLYFGKYRDIDNNARALYMMLLDMVSFSERNGWYNKKEELYVRCKRSTMAFRIGGVSRPTIQKCYEQLEAVGLIDRERNGKTLADDIFPHLPEKIDATKEELEQLSMLDEEDKT